VEDYIRYRPSYPPEVVSLLADECGLTGRSVIADVGSGTGLLAELFLRRGCAVFGVEPNAEMRAAGERLLAGFAQFTSIDGRAEDTRLPNESVDFVAAGQAFHWFDAAAARAEFARILRPPGWVVMIWNERLVDASPFLSGYEALLREHSTDYEQVDHRRIDASVIGAFFGHDEWHSASLPNEQRFDLDGVRGRLHSSSYAPPPGAPAYAPLMAGVERLFRETQEHGFVSFLYETKMYYGTCHPPSAESAAGPRGGST
jgi:SAM-dependent methyltransferase